MIKKLTISAVILTTVVLPLTSAKADGFLDLSDNSHISDNISFIKGLTQNNVAPENTPESTQTSAPVVHKTEIKAAPIATYVIMASAYSSTPDQTDSTPFVTAWGTRVRDGIVAANFLPFGTIIKIPELYGDKTFTVEDRMNRRYTYKIDVWFPERIQAMEFGNKKVKIEVVATL